MDYTMNNQTLDELVKRDKKLGRIAGKGGKPNQPNRNGKKPNRMQQQRNMVAAAKSQNRNNNNQKGGQNQKGGNGQQKQGNKNQQVQQQSQRMPQRIKNRGAGIYKQKNAVRNNQQAGKVVKTAQGGKGRVMQTNVQGKRQKRALQQPQGGAKQQVGNKRRQLLQQKLTKRNRAQGGNTNNNKGSASKNQGGKQMQPVVQYTPKTQKPASQVVPTGTLSQRKLKVRNIDANTVTIADLQKLFSKCGALISSGFDKNMHGQYLGSATLIYVKATSAAAAIKQYNNAQLDDRTMKIEYALPTDVTTPRVNTNTVVPSKKSSNQQRQKTAKQPLPMRKGNNAIQKKQRAGGNNQAKAGASGNAKAKRGLGGRRQGGKTLSLAPGGGRRQQAARKGGRK